MSDDGGSPATSKVSPPTPVSFGLNYKETPAKSASPENIRRTVENSTAVDFRKEDKMENSKVTESSKLDISTESVTDIGADDGEVKVQKSLVTKAYSSTTTTAKESQPALRRKYVDASQPEVDRTKTYKVNGINSRVTNSGVNKTELNVHNTDNIDLIKTETGVRKTETETSVRKRYPGSIAAKTELPSRKVNDDVADPIDRWRKYRTDESSSRTLRTTSSSSSSSLLTSPSSRTPTTEQLDLSSYVRQKVEMVKGAVGLGFCIEGGKGSPLGDRPIMVKRLFKGKNQ